MRYKELDCDLVKYIKLHDIIALVETWSSELDEIEIFSNVLQEYDNLVIKHGVKLSKYGRPSGGFLVYVRKYLSKYISYVSEFECGVVLELDEQLLGYPTFCVITYLPPQGSSFYTHCQSDGFALLENKLINLKASHPDHMLIISGDFNARTKNCQDFILDDSLKFLPLPNIYVESTFNIKRKSKDMHSEPNDHGKSLIKLCTNFDVHFLNGRAPGDEEGELTCYTGNGSSLVDYTMVSTELFRHVRHFEIGAEDHLTHLPQSVTFKTGVGEQTDESSAPLAGRRRDHFMWTDNSMEELVNSDQIPTFYSDLDERDPNRAVNTFVTLLQSVCLAKYKKIKSVKPKQQPWWDRDLDVAKAHKYKCLRFLRINDSKITKLQYRVARNKFKALVKLKKCNYRKHLRERLEHCKSASDFWKFIQSCKKSKTCSNTISNNEWELYFAELLNVKNVLDEEFQERVNSYLSWHDTNCIQCKQSEDVENSIMDKSVTLNEIENVIDNLAVNKAPGIDGICNEILKKSKMLTVPMLCSLFNKILETGIYPEEWCKSIIVPVYKQGNTNDPNNYRGISLLSCIGKIFTKIINNRLTEWANNNNKFAETQAGYRQGKSTIDQIFVLQTLASKCLNKTKGRFYSVFVDFSKAFDSVPHSHLFYSLLNSNLHGRVITLLRDMYSKLQSCVQVGDYSISSDFKCGVGTRQGCMVSPILFILYLNELTQLVEECNCQGMYIDENHPNVNMLLYADDLVIVGDHVGRVQKVLNVLAEFCVRWGLKVNMAKTKAMIFRNGGIINKNEVFYYKGTKLENVTYYKYLGVIISTRLSWSPAQVTLSLQGSKALNVINQVNYKSDYSFKIACEIFDKCIVPILTYGSEIWGASVHNSIESVHNKFCKNQLGVSVNTPDPAVLGECGRDHMYVKCVVKCIKYWLKLVSLHRDSLLASSYALLYRQCLLGKQNWASKIKDILYKYGFGVVWENQSVSDNYFIKDFIDRVKDCEIQQWSSSIHDMPKLRTYSLYKVSRNTELYLFLPLPRRLRVALARFRTGNHSLEIEKGRHMNIIAEDRLCKLCGMLKNIVAIEDEFHVLFQCPVYSELRSLYFPSLLSNLFNFVQLLKTEEPETLVNLAHYVFSMFKLRREYLQSLHTI